MFVGVDIMTIGERIKQKRIELNLSQDELAKKVGYKSRSSIQKIEAARDLPLRKISRMASALGTSPGYLMGWEDEEEVSVVATIVPVEPTDTDKAIELFLPDIKFEIKRTKFLDGSMTEIDF